MPPPHKITSMGVSVHGFPAIVLACGPAATRGGNNRNFHVYLELTMQAKHDSVIAGYCQNIGVVFRRTQGTQVAHNFRTGNAALTGFYTNCARVAAEVVCAQMTARWAAQPQGAPSPVFTRLAPGTLGSQAAQVDASVQRVTQRDGLGYEISYWYDGRDIYVLFHCYPGR